MPEIKHFVVTQTREVEVAAKTALDAVHIAQAAFDNGQNANHGVTDGPEGIWGNTTSAVSTKEVNCRLKGS